MVSSCESCDRRFNTTQALQHHIRDSPAHTTTFACKECDRTFKTAHGLQQHIRDSPAHSTVLSCRECNRTFNTEQALQQHIRDAPVHSTNFACQECNRSFGTAQALQQHTCNSPAHANDESAEEDIPSFDMRPSLHGDVSRQLDQYGLTFHFAPIDDPNDFLKEYDTTIVGAFTCTNDSCRKRRWTSKRVAITIRKLSDLSYNARVYYQRCERCGFVARPDLDDSYAERVAYRLAKWSGVAVSNPYFSGRSDRPHQEELCEGCRLGRCLAKQSDA